MKIENSILEKRQHDNLGGACLGGLQCCCRWPREAWASPTLCKNIVVPPTFGRKLSKKYIILTIPGKGMTIFHEIDKRMWDCSRSFKQDWWTQTWKHETVGKNWQTQTSRETKTNKTEIVWKKCETWKTIRTVFSVLSVFAAPYSYI